MFHTSSFSPNLFCVYPIPELATGLLRLWFSALGTHVRPWRDANVSRWFFIDSKPATVSRRDEMLKKNCRVCVWDTKEDCHYHRALPYNCLICVYKFYTRRFTRGCIVVRVCVWWRGFSGIEMGRFFRFFRVARNYVDAYE